MQFTGEIDRRAGRPCVAGVVLTACLLLFWLAGCTPRVQAFGPDFTAPGLETDAFIARDGRRLPYRAWLPTGAPQAVVMALHGFNMYRGYFDRLGPWLAERGIATYAYDQRGFGGAPERGIWGGAEAMSADAADFARLLRTRHPGLSLHLLGVSMGGAVAILALSGEAPPPVDSAILVAPAVWGGAAMHPAARIGIWLAAHTMPWNRVTGSALRVRPTDNTEVLRRLGRDPLVIKSTRIDSVYGVTRLMGKAHDAMDGLKVPILVLYGANDEIVPARPVRELVASLRPPRRFAVYAEGWHMLVHDLQAEVVWRDIAAWIARPDEPLPSGADAAVSATAAK